MIGFITVMAWIIGVILLVIFGFGVVPYLFSSTITLEGKGMVLGRSWRIWMGLIACVVWIIVNW